jgi:hypothetical protein
MNSTTVVLPLVDAKLYAGTANTTAPLPPTTLVTTVENVSVKATWDEAQLNNRNSGFKQSLPTLVAVELEVNFNGDSADTYLANFRTAAFNRYPMPIAVRDGAGFNFTGLMGVFSGDNDQPLAGNDGNKFTLKPWAVGVSGSQPAFA